jgi:hypothetical protein
MPARFLPQSLDHDLVEARLAARLASALSESSEELPPSIRERLRFGREQAVARAVAGRRTDTAGRTAAGALLLNQFNAWWPRLGALLPVLVLAFGAWVVVDAGDREAQRVATSIDVALLADDLPPEAYADPGFVAFLKLQQP